MAYYDDNNSVNPMQRELQNKEFDVPRSRFNLSHMRYYPGKVGAIMPIDMIETLPNEDYEIQISHLVKLAIPMASQYFGSFRIFTHVYHQEYHCMWEGADSHYTNGRSGTLDVRKPTLCTTLPIKSSNKRFYTDTLNSPLDYLCLPIGYVSKENDKYINTKPLFVDNADVLNSSVNKKVSALPFVMYHNICRDYYAPTNLIQNNKLLLPDNPNDMILPYNASGKSVNVMYRSNFAYSYVDNPLSFSGSLPDTSYFGGYDDTEFGSALLDVSLNVMRYRSYRGDYFTTASPFPNLLRGLTPEIDLAGTATTDIDWSDVFMSNSSEVASSLNNLEFNSTLTKIGASRGNVGGASSFVQLKPIFNNARVNATVSSHINLNQLRQLEAITIFRERMARTNGSYNEMIESQGLGNPGHEHNRPRYLGGSYQDLVFSDVTQLAQSDNAPLGTRVSQAMSSASGDVIRFHSKDYGCVMVCVSVVPDTVYSQGIDRVWTKLSNAEEYFPILNNLSPQPVLNKEIYYQNGAEDDELFGYQERFSEYKSMRDKVSGCYSLPNTEYRKILAQRRFTSLPTLSPSFLSLSNFDYSIFANSLEMPFTFVTALNISKVSPMPYTTVPGGLQARA